MSQASQMVVQFCEANNICVRCKCRFSRPDSKLCAKCIAYILKLPSGFAKRIRRYFDA